MEQHLRTSGDDVCKDPERFRFHFLHLVSTNLICKFFWRRASAPLVYLMHPVQRFCNADINIFLPITYGKAFNKESGRSQYWEELLISIKHTSVSGVGPAGEVRSHTPLCRSALSRQSLPERMRHLEERNVTAVCIKVCAVKWSGALVFIFFWWTRSVDCKIFCFWPLQTNRHRLTWPTATCYMTPTRSSSCQRRIISEHFLQHFLCNSLERRQRFE